MWVGTYSSRGNVGNVVKEIKAHSRVPSLFARRQWHAYFGARWALAETETETETETSVRCGRGKRDGHRKKTKTTIERATGMMSR
jgi:hypothetical protein